MKGSTILRIVSAGLQDLEPDVAKRWAWTAGVGTGGVDTSIGLLDYLNSALRAVAMQRPDCFSVTEMIQLEAGMRQTLPKRTTHSATYDAIGFCELTRNIKKQARRDADGNVVKDENNKTVYDYIYGRAILLSPQSAIMAWLDPDNPNNPNPHWDTSIDNYAYDRASNPNVYWVYPPPLTKRLYVEATYYAMPPEITAATQEIGISDGYAQAIAHHMLASVMDADSETSGSAKARYHMELFFNLMDIKLQVDARLPRAFNTLSSKIK